MHTSKIKYPLLLSFRNTKHRADHISKLSAKFGANNWRIANDIGEQCTNQNQYPNLHLPKIEFIFPVHVLFTTEYKVHVA